ncbi:MAG: carbamoyltransferase HypF [Candidatus Dormibacteraeota bacterium]|nr:carbamoyltransferase HypF [Candidatus Dormibacteraeota bacterium]
MTLSHGGPSADRRISLPVTESVHRERWMISVRGVVQGVGFRPFVWRLARARSLAGSVRNTLDGVVIEAEGSTADLKALVREVVELAPNLARVDLLTVDTLDCTAQRGFQITLSAEAGTAVQAPPPDAVVCTDCLAELADPFDRRYRYPFINCTGCGPRFTIIESLPYDRERTTMRQFLMCDACRREYEDAGDRRFHAEPVACPDCGPLLWLAEPDGGVVWGDPVDIAAAALRHGAIVAVKGLGGFQLACDASDATAITLLRERKHRPSKPLAVMVADLSAARSLAEIDADAATALTHSSGPIVLVPLVNGAPLMSGVTCGLDEVGLMLPSTPLHYLLLAEAGGPLVMTSGNISDEPICRDNDEALERLGEIGDLFLLHDRDITSRYDDSVRRPASVVRAGRGLTPGTLPLPEATVPGIAFGAHLKNTFALLSEGRLLLSPHLGDLDTPLARENAAATLDTYLRLFRVEPQAVACDLHPDYASTASAEALADKIGVQPTRVQHHHAHIASVMVEHGLRGQLVGVALDGIGLGADGTVWGGEILLADECSAERAGHIATVRQPGGDRCAREGWRMAAAYLGAAGGRSDELPGWWGTSPTDATTWAAITRLATSDASPVSSSCGRLFDAVASLLEVAHQSTYEGEAAMLLEAAARRADTVSPMPVDIADTDGALVVDTVGLVGAIAERRARGDPVETLAAIFHVSLGAALADVAARVATAGGLDRVALSGGCFQNRFLQAVIEARLQHAGLRVFVNVRVPANDGGISAGQGLVLAATQAATR